MVGAREPTTKTFLFPAGKETTPPKRRARDRRKKREMTAPDSAHLQIGTAGVAPACGAGCACTGSRAPAVKSGAWRARELANKARACSRGGYNQTRAPSSPRHSPPRGSGLLRCPSPLNQRPRRLQFLESSLSSRAKADDVLCAGEVSCSGNRVGGEDGCGVRRQIGQFRAGEAPARVGRRRRPCRLRRRHAARRRARHRPPVRRRRTGTYNTKPLLAHSCTHTHTHVLWELSTP